MMQLAKQAEADELKALLLRMDEKLDYARRDERDKKLAKMDRCDARHPRSRDHSRAWRQR